MPEINILYLISYILYCPKCCKNEVIAACWSVLSRLLQQFKRESSLSLYNPKNILQKVCVKTKF